MQVRFIKYCPWSYRLTRGTLKKHLEDTLATVPDIEGQAMIAAGYAKEVEKAKPTERKIIAPPEHKIVAPDEVKREVEPRAFKRRKGGKNK